MRLQRGKSARPRRQAEEWSDEVLTGLLQPRVEEDSVAREEQMMIATQGLSGEIGLAWQVERGQKRQP